MGGPPHFPARLQALDEAAFRRIAGWHAPMLDRLLPRLSLAASYSRLWMAVSAVVAVVGGRRGRRTAMRALFSIALTSALANLVMKGAARRPRPIDEVPVGRRLPHPGSSSFPSGHSASAAVFSGVVGGAIPALRLPLNAVAVAVAFSRTYTGVHYPSDVAAGWLLGKSVAAVVRRIARPLA